MTAEPTFCRLCGAEPRFGGTESFCKGRRFVGLNFGCRCRKQSGDTGTQALRSWRADQLRVDLPIGVPPSPQSWFGEDMIGLCDGVELAERTMTEFDALKQLVLAVEQDVLKATGGNKAAGTRVRKAMQDVKRAAQEVRKALAAKPVEKAGE